MLLCDCSVIRSTTLTTRILSSGSAVAQQVDRRQRLQRRHVAGAGHHDVRLARRRRVPAHSQMPTPARQWASASSAVSHCGAGCLPATMTLMRFIGPQAMVGHPQQRVGVRREIEPDRVGLLVGDEIDEAGILVAEAVVVLPPDMRGQQIVQRGDRLPPRQLARDLQPLGVLVDHRVDDVDEGLVAGEQAVPAGEQIALQPALAEMLADSTSMTRPSRARCTS